MKNEIKEKKIYNRLGAIMTHTNRYAFNPASRLAKDTGLSYNISAVFYWESMDLLIILRLKLLKP